MKILHIFGRMQRGGAEMRTVDLLRHLDPARYQFHFCTLSGQPGVLDEEIQTLGGHIHPCPLGPGFPWRFRRLLRSGRFDVVHAHVHNFSGYILRLAHKERVPTRIAHFRITNDGHGNGWPRQVQRSILRRWLDQSSTHILAVNEGSMIAAYGPQWKRDPRCRVIYNGLDPQAFAGPRDDVGVRAEFSIPVDGHLYIHVGRMDPQKNHRRLIAIFAAIARDDPAAYLLLVGLGRNAVERELRQRVVELGIARHVVFAGLRSDVPRLLKAADLLIFPSLWEGLPGAVLEATAAGTPVLASDLPGVLEIAARLPLVHSLSLNCRDGDWKQMAHALMMESRAEEIREDAARRFRASVFTIADCAEAHCAVWCGEGRVMARRGPSATSARYQMDREDLVVRPRRSVLNHRRPSMPALVDARMTPAATGEPSTLPTGSIECGRVSGTS